MMKKSSLAISLLAASLFSGAAFAQAPAPGGAPSGAPGAAPSAPSTPAAKPAEPSDVKFVAADKDKSGSLEGAELDAYKADLTKIDMNKDGKISKDEFAAAMKSGVIK